MAKRNRRAKGTGLKSDSSNMSGGAFGGSRSVVIPGNGPLFPGPRYQVHRRAEPPNLDDLIDTANQLARELGPDHPRVRMMRKEIADRRQVQ
jgi:hypothetical protein